MGWVEWLGRSGWVRKIMAGELPYIGNILYSVWLVEKVRDYKKSFQSQLRSVIEVTGFGVKKWRLLS